MEYNEKIIQQFEKDRTQFPVDKKQYIEAYKICCNSVSDNSILPPLNDTQIIKYISKENWLLFPLKIETSKEDAKTESRPNVYLALLGNNFRMGITLNQIKAVECFCNIVESHSEEKKIEILNMLNQLSEDYITVVNRKIKDKFHMQAPKYVIEFEKKSNSINSEYFEEMVKTAYKIREEGTIKRKDKDGKYYSELPEIELAAIQTQFNKENLEIVTNQLFPILKLCLSIETVEENQAGMLYKKLLQDNTLKQFKNDKTEYYEQFVQRQYPNISVGKFRELFNKAIKEREKKNL